MSTVFYRWGAGRDESRVTFDGTHISVFDLKREIILNNKMGNGKDFDLSIYDNVTGEELKDDNQQIPRSSSLIARRLPPSQKGRGNAQNYIAGTSAADSLTGDHRIEAHAKQAMQDKMSRGVRGVGGTFGSLTKRFDGKEEENQAQVSTGDKEEDAKIQAILAQGEETWEQMQEDMSQGYRPAAGRPRPAKPGAPAAPGKYDFSIAPDKEPPVGYICYRCGKKGHWIQNCPENDDPAVAERKRFVRVTGIPRSFLKTVDTPVGAEGSSEGAMLTADGGFVKAVPDQSQWRKQTAVKPRALTGADVRDQEPLEAELSCPICKKLVWEAVRTPCCQAAFCEECIHSHLLENDFECPNCESKVPSLDKLKPDEALRDRSKRYVDSELEKNKDAKDEEKDEEARKEGQESVSCNETSEGCKAQFLCPQSEEGVVNDASKNQIIGPDGQPLDVQLTNPQTIQNYLVGARRMLLNPSLSNQSREILNSHLRTLQENLVQLQMLAMMNGMGMGTVMPGMNDMSNNINVNNMHMSGMGNMMDHGMGMNMANMGMPVNHFQPNFNQPNFQPGFQQNHSIPTGFRGRGGFRGGFRGRGMAPGAFQARPPNGPAMNRSSPLKRGPETQMSGDTKQQKIGA
nr:protein MPE1 [Cryptococcus depauperatus CBS 7855]